MTTEWARKAEFINNILNLAVSYTDLKRRDVKLDGIPGENFKRAIKVVGNAIPSRKSQRQVYIDTAIAYCPPVNLDQLESEAANCTFGEAWAEVMALCYAPTSVAS